MHSLPVWQQYNPQISAVHLCDLRPTTNPAVPLHRLLDRFVDNALNPLIANDGAVWA